jgi:hypothetical protein
VGAGAVYTFAVETLDETRQVAGDLEWVVVAVAWATLGRAVGVETAATSSAPPPKLLADQGMARTTSSFGAGSSSRRDFRGGP